MTHGGKRAGAGRPIGSGPGVTTRARTVRMTPADLARWDALCVRMGLSQPGVVRAGISALERAPEDSTEIDQEERTNER